MKILFYLEPFIHSSQSPQFFLPYLETIVKPMIGGLLQNKAEVVLFFSELHQSLFKNDIGIDTKYIDQKELEKIFLTYENYITIQKEKNSEAFKPLVKIIKQKLDNFKPDIVICLSTNGIYLKNIFLDIPILFNESGVFSYETACHHTMYLDNCCDMRDSFLLKNKNALKQLKVNDENLIFVNKIINHFKKDIINSEYFNVLKQKLSNLPYKKYVLFSLQRWEASLFQLQTEYNTELEYIEAVLANIDKQIGVIITMHKASSIIANKYVQQYLTQKYSNALFIDDIKNPSNTAILFCQGVITTSSTTGIYSLFFNKKLLVPSKTSYLNFIADSNNIKDFSSIILSEELCEDKKNILYYLLTHYYIPSNYFRNGKWLYTFLSNAIEKYKDNLGLDFYSKIDSDENLLLSHTFTGKKEKIIKNRNFFKRLFM